MTSVRRSLVVLLLTQTLVDLLQGLFSPFEIESAVELTLGANADLDSVKRLMWNVQDMGTTNSGPCLALCAKSFIDTTIMRT